MSRFMVILQVVVFCLLSTSQRPGELAASADRNVTDAPIGRTRA